MKRTVLLAACLLALPVAYAQKAAEQFIPLGQSPGLSGTQTFIGRIDVVDGFGGVTLSNETAASGPVRIVPTTRIWLDRSRLRLGNVSGSVADLLPGRRAEIKFADANRREAEWIKVELAP